MAQTQEFRGTARAIHTDAEGNKHFVYHRTAVVTKRTDGSIVLDSGGWRTNTTRTAMNQASTQDGLGFQVYQRAKQWFVDMQGRTLPFADGMVLSTEA